MDQAVYIEKIIEALKMGTPNLGNIGADSKFCDVPNMDSMSIIDFQMNLKKLIGDKAGNAMPALDTTLAEFAEQLSKL